MVTLAPRGGTHRGVPGLDLFVFFVFFEAMLVPMYFIIGIWGGERRIYAAIKFFLYTAFGSALMLAGIIALGLSTRHRPAPHLRLRRTCSASTHRVHPVVAVRRLRPRLRHQGAVVPVPHLAPRRPRGGPDRRLGDAGRRPAEAGHLRLAPLQPHAVPRGHRGLVPVLAVLAVIGIVYGAMVAIVQPDLKKLVAYSSVSHLGFIVLGIFALTSPACRAR
jgi:NADH-quinone oxidoreductase subunit M